VGFVTFNRWVAINYEHLSLNPLTCPSHLQATPESANVSFHFCFSEKIRGSGKFKLHARHPTFLRRANDQPCEQVAKRVFFLRRRRNVFRREIFCVLFSENNLVVICFSGNFFCSVCSCRTHERTNETTKKRNVPRLRSRSESLFLQPDEVLVASSPVCRVVFSSHSCSVCANEGHCLLLGTMARLQTVATVATRPASA